MRRKSKICVILMLAVLLLSGCSMRTIDQLYCLPERSEAVTNIQTQIDKGMAGLVYCAPVSGENRQTVQTADLDGDGKNEYIVFARDNSEKPLKILIFTPGAEGYQLAHTIESAGTAFDQVLYVPMNGAGGYELVVGRQVSDQILRSVSVYSFDSGKAEHLVTAGYSKFVCKDMDTDRIYELLVLRPGIAADPSGAVELYMHTDAGITLYSTVPMSAPVENLRRVTLGQLNDGTPALYASAMLTENTLVTDVFTLAGGVLSNISKLDPASMTVEILRDYYIFPADLNRDGVAELPQTVPMKMPGNGLPADNQAIIRWRTVDSAGTGTVLMHTYHNFAAGWYLDLNTATPERILIIQQGNTFTFNIWNEDYSVAEKIMTVYVLTGEHREEQAAVKNRIVLQRTESAIYAVDLEPSSASYNITKEGLLSGFHLILEDWKIGEHKELGK